MTKIERVKKLCKWLIFDGFADNDADLAKKLGYSKSSFSQIINERVPLSTKFIDNLCNSNKNINKVWITELKGSMLKESDNILTNAGNYNILEESSETYKTMPGTNEGIPLIPIEAMAGYGAGEMQIMEFESERFVVPTFKGADFLIQVKGSSMYPKYNSGDIVACKKLHLNDLFFQWNKVYVLDTEQGALIKRIDIAQDDDHIMIVSDNEKYRPFPLHKSKINAISIVMGVIRLE